MNIDEAEKTLAEKGLTVARAGKTLRVRNEGYLVIHLTFPESGGVRVTPKIELPKTDILWAPDPDRLRYVAKKIVSKLLGTHSPARHRTEARYIKAEHPFPQQAVCSEMSASGEIRRYLPWDREGYTSCDPFSLHPHGGTREERLESGLAILRELVQRGIREGIKDAVLRVAEHFGVHPGELFFKGGARKEDVYVVKDGDYTVEVSSNLGVRTYLRGVPCSDLGHGDCLAQAALPLAPTHAWTPQPEALQGRKGDGELGPAVSRECFRFWLGKGLSLDDERYVLSREGEKALVTFKGGLQMRIGKEGGATLLCAGDTWCYDRDTTVLEELLPGIIPRVIEVWKVKETGREIILLSSGTQTYLMFRSNGSHSPLEDARSKDEALLQKNLDRGIFMQVPGEVSEGHINATRGPQAMLLRVLPLEGEAPLFLDATYVGGLGKETDAPWSIGDIALCLSHQLEKVFEQAVVKGVEQGQEFGTFSDETRTTVRVVDNDLVFTDGLGPEAGKHRFRDADLREHERLFRDAYLTGSLVWTNDQHLPLRSTCGRTMRPSVIWGMGEKRYLLEMGEATGEPSDTVIPWYGLSSPEDRVLHPIYNQLCRERMARESRFSEMLGTKAAVKEEIKEEAQPETYPPVPVQLGAPRGLFASPVRIEGSEWETTVQSFGEHLVFRDGTGPFKGSCRIKPEHLRGEERRLSELWSEAMRARGEAPLWLGERVRYLHTYRTEPLRALAIVKSMALRDESRDDDGGLYLVPLEMEHLTGPHVEGFPPWAGITSSDDEELAKVCNRLRGTPTSFREFKSTTHPHLRVFVSRKHRQLICMEKDGISASLSPEEQSALEKALQEGTPLPFTLSVAGSQVTEGYPGEAPPAAVGIPLRETNGLLGYLAPLSERAVADEATVATVAEEVPSWGNLFPPLQPDPQVTLLSEVRVAQLRAGGRQVAKMVAVPLSAASGLNLQSPVGLALLHVALSLALPQVQGGQVVSEMAREMRIDGLASLGDEMMDLLMGPLREALAAALLPMETPAPQEPPQLGDKTVDTELPNLRDTTLV